MTDSRGDRAQRDELERVERLFEEFSAAFPQARTTELEPVIDRCLERLGTALGIDRVTFWELFDRQTWFRATHGWAAAAFPRLPRDFAVGRFPWFTETLRRGEVISFSRWQELPEEAAAEKESFQDQGARSHLSVPLAVGGSVIGALSFGALREERSWPPELVRRIQLVARVVGDALGRSRALEALRVRAAALEAANDAILILDARHPQRPIVFASQGFVRLTGFTESEVLDRPPEFMSGPGTDLRLVAEVWKSIERGESFENEVLCYRKDGTPFWAAFRMSPVRNHTGEITHFVGIGNEVTERKRADEALRASEERLRLLVETTNVIPWEADGETWLFTYVGPQAVKVLGHPVEAWYRPDFWPDHIHPEDREYAVDFCLRSSETRERFDFEYRMLTSGGSTIWMHDFVTVDFDAHGRKRLRGFLIDVTDRKEIEATLRDLSSRLIDAQEAERRRVARELHDDVNQRLALLSVNLELMGQGSETDASVIRERVPDLVSQIRELSSAVHQLSHRLHPAKLDQLGLAAALASLCEEFGETRELRIEFSHRNLPEVIPDDVALCFYRVAQEALHNVTQHSGSTQARVALSAGPTGLRLEVSDSGVGFNAESARRKGGLGLIGMRERLRLLGGDFEVRSRPSRGTVVVAGAPLTHAKPALNTTREAR